MSSLGWVSYLVIGVIPGLEDVPIRVEGGEKVDLRGSEELRDAGVGVELFTEGPGQVEQQLPPHHLITVDSWIGLKL